MKFDPSIFVKEGDYIQYVRKYKYNCDEGLFTDASRASMREIVRSLYAPKVPSLVLTPDQIGWFESAVEYTVKNC